MNEDIYLLTLCLFLGAVVLIFGLRAAASVVQARAKIASEAGYRQVAERAAAAEADTATSLTSIQAAVEEVRSRLTAVETILKAVE